MFEGFLAFSVGYRTTLLGGSTVDFAVGVVR